MKKDYSFEQAFSNAWRTFLAHTSDIVFIKDPELVYIGASKPFAELLGLSDPSEVVGKTDMDLFEDKDMGRHYIRDDKLLLAEGMPLENYIEPMLSKDGTAKWALTSKYIVRDEKGDVLAIYGISRDVTAQTRLRVDYIQEIEHLMNLPDSAAIHAILFDLTTGLVIRSASKFAEDGFASDNKTVEAYCKCRADEVRENEEVKLFFRSMTESAVREMYNQGRRGLTLEYVRVWPDGNSRWLRAEARFLIDPENNHLMTAFLLSDIDGEKSRQLALERAAELDSMTGLFNHDAAIGGIERFLQTEGAGKQHALFVIDIDNFKNVNDTMGHLKGDEVITDVAATIKHIFRSTDIVGRVGGDEFLVLMKDIPDPAFAKKKADELIDALQYVYSACGCSIELTSSAGVSLYHGDGKSVKQFLAEADAALYRAKARGKKQYSFANMDVERLRPDTAAYIDQSGSIQLRVLLEHMNGGVVLCDVDTDISITYISPSFFKMIGQVPDSLGDYGRKLFDMIHPHDLPGLKAALFRLADDGGIMDQTYRIADRQDELRWHHVRGIRLRIDDNSTRKLVNVVTDITTLKTSEQELMLSEERYKLAVGMMGAFVWELDIPNRRITQSPAMAERYGHHETVIENVPEALRAFDFVEAESREAFRELFAAIFRGERTGNVILHEKLKDGTCVWTRYSFTTICDHDGLPLRAVGIMEPLPNGELCVD